ncbi:MAG: helix-turn-helix domain-containing protein [Phycisphaerales bacterium]|nr:helix-turn-helix domain-containing protein [Phycisphaerales bacterium]
MSKRRDLLGLLAEAEAKPESVGFDLRLDLASIVLRALRQRGWSQSDLARAAGMKASFISRVVHSDANCEFETAGRILHALGLVAKLHAATRGGEAGGADSSSTAIQIIADTGGTDGQAIVETSETSWAGSWIEDSVAHKPVPSRAGLSR